MNRRIGATLASVASLACATAVVVAGSAGASTTGKVLPRGGKVVATIAIPEGYGGFAVGEGAVWTMSDDTSTLTRIDPQGNTRVASVKLKTFNACAPYVCGEPAVGNGAVWVPRASDNTVSRVDPSSNSVRVTIPVGKYPTAVAVTPGAVWVVNAGGPTVTRIDPAANKVAATIRIGPARAASDRGAVYASGGAIWATVPNLKVVVRIDPATNKITSTIRVSDYPCGFLAASEQTVWASGGNCVAVITRSDPRTKKSVGNVTGFLQPVGLALGFGSLWVADVRRKTIDRVSLRTGLVVARLPVGGFPVRLAVGFGSVWVRDNTGRVLRIKPQAV